MGCQSWHISSAPCGKLGLTLLSRHGAGEDKKVALWQTEEWKVTEQSKPLPKGAAQTVMFTHHGAAACGEEPCLLLVRPGAATAA